MADQDRDEDVRPSIDDYSRTLDAGYSHDEIRQSIERDSGLEGDELNAEYAKLQAATTVHPAPGEVPARPQDDTSGVPPAPAPTPGAYNPEQEQAALRMADQIADPDEKRRTQAYIKNQFANERIMDGVTQAAREKVIKTAVGQYSKAIEEIRDDPKSSLQQKQAIIRQLTKTMWNDPRVQYGETQGQLESYMQKLAFGEDAERLGPKFADGFHAVVTGEIRGPQQVLEMMDHGDVTWSGGQKLMQALTAKDKPDQAAIHQRIDFANQEIKNSVLKGVNENLGEKPTPKQYDRMNQALMALNDLILGAGGDLEKVAKITSRENVQEVLESVYPLYERNADYVTRGGGQAAFGDIVVPATIATDERSQLAYRDIVGVPPTVPNPKDNGKPTPLSPEVWADRVNRLLARPTRENIADFTKKYGQDGAYIVKSIKTVAPAAAPITATPASLTVPAGPERAPELARVTAGPGAETPEAVRKAAGTLVDFIRNHPGGGYRQAPGADVSAWSTILDKLGELQRGVPTPGVTP